MTIELRELRPEEQQALEQVLGYLNFSSGTADPQLLANLNRLYAAFGSEPAEAPHWRLLGRLLNQKLDELSQTSPAFADAGQARAILRLVWDGVLPGYLEFHRDLLFHQSDRQLFNAFFIARACEAALQQELPGDQPEPAVRGAIAKLNDFLGHRPVAVLESQKIEPYPHEWVRPVPLYVRGAGIAVGPYQELIAHALELLAQTDDDIKEAAYFDFELLDELAFDPRAYDFDHPVNKRPNYQFGCWDPHHIDNKGRYRRFVVQQVTLDALMARLEEDSELPRDELLREAAAVLAGTVLMASGVSGRGPGSHDSGTTLAHLVRVIAAYRDTFYQRLLSRWMGPHAERLQQETVERRQPFGGARQHLNAYLTRRRAAQLKHVHLAKVFARMGFTEASSRQADIVPVASARIRCQLECLLTQGHLAIERDDLETAAQQPEQFLDLLHRGIQCGALVDPWNILGFEAHFSLFPAMENSVHDHRVDELIDLVETFFELLSRLWSEAAARDSQALFERVDRLFQETAVWWRQYAAHEVSSVEAIDPLHAYNAARHVAEALRLWYKEGAGAGDVSFWAPYAEMFDSPQAYALVVEALLNRRDFIASMALLVHWLSVADRIDLEQGHVSFYELTDRWLAELVRNELSTAARPAETWQRARKFIDYVEANAGELWEVPQWELGRRKRSEADDELLDEELAEDEGEEDGLFQAAYEDVVFRDSTQDGIEGELADFDLTGDDELAFESRRVMNHLAFLRCLAGLWKSLAVGVGTHIGELESAESYLSALQNWGRQAADKRAQLTRLLEEVRRYEITAPGGSHDSLVEYDRRCSIQESLLEQIIAANIEMASAVRWLQAASAPEPSSTSKRATAGPIDADLGLDQQQVTAVFAALLRQDLDAVRSQWERLVEGLADKPLLYVPVARDGDPRKVVSARVRQQCLEDLLQWLPRLGLIVEACQLIETAREMERRNPVGPGAVTEFDELFKIGYKAVVENLVIAAEREVTQWSTPKRPNDSEVETAQNVLVKCLERITESLLVSWLEHSRTLRLSVLEMVSDEVSWEKLVAFIQRYGKQVFTQRFFTLGNLRAILHEGVDVWLKQLEEDPGELADWNLLAELDQELPRTQAVRWLSLVLEAIVENYGEYCDYNITTTQSDSGDHLYMLLDFLRLRVRYDRICWNLRPVVLAHQILVRRGHDRIARVWRRKLRERISTEADAFLEQLEELQRKYAMRLASVADRLAERFVQPLMVDRMRALIGPAMDEARGSEESPSFELLQREAERLAEQPSGGGIEVPGWLLTLEEEVHRKLHPPQEPLRVAHLNGQQAPAIDFDLLLKRLDEWAVRQQLRAEDLMNRRSE